ncbi:hypothetical protein BJ508DRAFT_302013 [Ascobolus immersus RN42]|uniref:Uncharacterized protein n=1 Tax=Ascobolus immersus RN42 TaxID=1160509 RepID=A0A3N4IPJ3_ASCIM|nr:hypothetical protein BJ508DRAFT_302013 [Ascobolus immersus RN42]
MPPSFTSLPFELHHCIHPHLLPPAPPDLTTEALDFPNPKQHDYISADSIVSIVRLIQALEPESVGENSASVCLPEHQVVQAHYTTQLAILLKRTIATQLILVDHQLVNDLRWSRGLNRLWKVTLDRVFAAFSKGSLVVEMRFWRMFLQVWDKRGSKALGFPTLPVDASNGRDTVASEVGRGFEDAGRVELHLGILAILHGKEELSKLVFERRNMRMKEGRSIAVESWDAEYDRDESLGAYSY